MNRTNLNGKRSQFYLFAGIILISLVFATISGNTIVAQEDVKSTRNHLNNYKYEGNIIINNAVYAKKNISAELRNFTESYIEYGNTKALDFKILFLYSNEGNIYIVNYINEPVLIQTLGTTVGKEEELITSFTDTIKINYKNETFSFDFSSSYEIEFKTLFIEGE